MDMSSGLEHRSGSALKLGFYAFLCLMGLGLYTSVFGVLGYLPGAIAGTTAAAFTANWISIRVFERGYLPDSGLWWTLNSRRNLGVGMALGIAAALLVTALPVLTGAAELVRDPEHPGDLNAGLYVTLLLVFGAVGEELMFRGYPFWMLLRGFGPVPAIVVTSALFALVHVNNLHFSPLALANTAGFGTVLGIAAYRSNSLWLPIGFHFGWNWVPPLIGVNLSGFTMGVAGYALRWKIPDLWSGGAYGPEGGLLTCGIVAGLLVFMLKAPIRHEQPPVRPVTRESDPTPEA